MLVDHLPPKNIYLSFTIIPNCSGRYFSLFFTHHIRLQGGSSSKSSILWRCLLLGHRRQFSRHSARANVLLLQRVTINIRGLLLGVVLLMWMYLCCSVVVMMIVVLMVVLLLILSVLKLVLVVLLVW